MIQGSSRRNGRNVRRGVTGLAATMLGLGLLTPGAIAQVKMSTPIEPFIEADAIALGKWLVTQKVKTLTEGTLDQLTQPSPQTTSQNTTNSPNSSTNPPAAENTTNSKTAATTTTGAPERQSANSSATASAPAPERQPATIPAAAEPPAPSNALTIDGALEMRVALVRDASSVSIATSNGGAVVSLDGEGLKSLAAGQGYRAADQGNLTIGGDSMPGAVWVQGDGGVVAVGDRWYRGRVLLLLRQNGILVVNYVLLQEYLYSVVGAEMSASWPIESLKAQAVAARSYALVHNVRHAGREYDLDDTTRYQAYKGVMTEANTTQAAVQQTAGEFISYDGGIVESLYAATQNIVNNAHSGFGMSQMGALDLSRQGYRYNEILAVYYPDTAIGRIDIGE